MKSIFRRSARFASLTIFVAMGLAHGAGPCPRFPVGSVILQPEDLFSQHGVLRVNMTYETTVDPNGKKLFCFVNGDGAQSPTLHVHPGDRLQIKLTNHLPVSPQSDAAMSAMPGMTISGRASNTCDAVTMTASSVNIHYHGTNTPPTCHQDEVIRTMINSGETFSVRRAIPAGRAAGPVLVSSAHSRDARGGGARRRFRGAGGGGIQNLNPEVAGPEQLLMIRDNLVPGGPTPGGNIPSWDVSLNYVPVPSPSYTPAVIQMKPGERQLWRRAAAA
jgi:hypothetical protein